MATVKPSVTRNPGGGVTVVNPATSVIARVLPINIRRRHVLVALTLTERFYAQGRFPPPWNVWIGAGSAVPDLSGPRIPSPGVAPRRLRRRGLESLGEVYKSAAIARRIPFPGRIQITREGEPVAEALLAAVDGVNSGFHQRAPVSGASAERKGHPIRYARSLYWQVEGSSRLFSARTMRRALGTMDLQPGLLLHAVVVAPHASRLERDLQLMRGIAVGLAQSYSPALAVGFDFIPSDSVGFRFGAGTGGPRNGPRGASPQVYALPRISLLVPQAGRRTRLTIAPAVRRRNRARRR